MPCTPPETTAVKDAAEDKQGQPKQGQYIFIDDRSDGSNDGKEALPRQPGAEHVVRHDSSSEQLINIDTASHELRAYDIGEGTEQLLEGEYGGSL